MEVDENGTTGPIVYEDKDESDEEDSEEAMEADRDSKDDEEFDGVSDIEVIDGMTDWCRFKANFVVFMKSGPLCILIATPH